MLVCESCKLDPAKFLPLKMSAIKPSGVSVATREFVESWIKTHGTLTAVNVNDFANELLNFQPKSHWSASKRGRSESRSDGAGPSRLPPPPASMGFVDPSSPDWRTKAFLQACKKHGLCNRCGKRGHARKDCIVRIEGDDVQKYRTMEKPPGAK